MYFIKEYSIKDLDKYLTKSEILDLLHVLDTARYCVDEEGIKGCVVNLKKIIPFDCFLYGCAAANRDVLHTVNVDYSPDYLKRYVEKKYEQIDPIATMLIEKRKVINWKDVDKSYKKRPELIVNHEAKEFGLRDGFTYGGDDSRNILTFWFAGEHVERCDRSKAVIEFAVRALTFPLKAIYEKASRCNKQGILSKKETEVLSWLKEGKSSWDISKILRISERTVNFHVNNIVAKLDAMNRTHAVAIAVADQLIDP
ncbi:MAG: LuxR family transcriptional regulator [Syntrophaceae bacterium]|nr:LuxR family transcriptional regulator [Syntrophaceae bacterium]